LRRFAFLFFLALILFCAASASAEDWDSFVVEDEEESVSPDPRVQAWALMRRMTDEEKIYQLFYVCPEMLTGESRTVAMPKENMLKTYPVGGVILFGQNIESESQLVRITSTLQSQAAQAGLYPLLIGVDEEGGTVSRVANKLGYPLVASPAEIGALNSEDAAREAGKTIAAYLTPLGINMSFSPPADTVMGKAQAGVQIYGEDPALVSRLAAAMAEGLREGGVTPCYTHFPGWGAMDGYSLGTMSIRRTPAELGEKELIPFRDGIQSGIEMILVSHAYLRTVGDDFPASTSAQVITGILRRELGYDGVIITDSLRMAAVTTNYKKGQESLAALKAGADMLLLPPDLDAAVSAIKKALATGEITMARIEESVSRILAVKIQRAMISGE